MDQVKSLIRPESKSHKLEESQQVGADRQPDKKYWEDKEGPSQESYPTGVEKTQTGGISTVWD